MTSARPFQQADGSRRGIDPWLLLAMLIPLVVGVALRSATSIRSTGAIYDEDLIRIPIDDLNEKGWSVATAIDFEETKGPTMIWSYAAISRLVGAELNDLRLISVGFFILGLVPLLLIGRECGVRGPPLLLVGLLYVLLPYHATLGQLLMSEASFVFGMLLLLWIVFWTLREDSTPLRRLLGTVAYGLLLAVLLHHRIHAVALAGAVCLTGFERQGRDSWPWWVASICAGLSRLPLWARWGGLVSPEYQGAFDLGVSPSSVTYLIAALVPLVGIFLIAAPFARERRVLRAAMAGAVFGLLAGAVAAPAMDEELIMANGLPVLRFLGITATAVRVAGEHQWLARVLLALAAGVGGGGLAALAALAWRAPIAQPIGLLYRLQVWMLATGIGMYAMTRAAVFDRYLLPWAVLLPLIWLKGLPRALLVVQGVVLAAALGWHLRAWLL